MISFVNKEKTDILDLCLKYWANYVQDTINKFAEPKSSRTINHTYPSSEPRSVFINKLYGGHLGFVGEI